MNLVDNTAPTAPPSWALLGLEPVRALLEYAGMRAMDRSKLPRGDGEPVVIFPGLAADERVTAPLKSFCDELGYAAYDWGWGRNTGPRGDADAWIGELAQHVTDLTAAHDERVNLIGWSLGGIYAREVAKLMPRRTRQVITIGTPAGDVGQTNVSALYRLLNGRTSALDDATAARLRIAPAVPTTSIYSRSDGVVAWQACVQVSVQRGRASVDNIEVEGSHVGMAWNPQVLAVIADKLAAPG